MDNFKSIFVIKKNNFFFLLLCMYPWALISGPFLSDIIGIILSLYLVVISIFQKNLKYYKNLYFIFFFLFCLFVSLNSIFNAQNLVSIKSAIFYLRFGFFAIAVHYILKINHEKLNIFFYSLLLALFVLSIDSAFQKIFGFNIVGIEKNEVRISSLFGDELILGSFVIKILPIALAFVIYLEQNIKLTKILTILILSLVPILLSAEKNAFVSLILLCIFIVFIFDYKIKIKLFFIFIVFSSFFLILSINKDTKSRLFKEYIQSMVATKSIYTQVHISHFKTAYKMYLDKPINGHGSKMFRFKCSDPKYVYDEFSCSTHPHNYYLQLLAETGLVGTFFFALFYLSLIIILFKSIKLKKIVIVNQNLPHSLLACSLLITFLPISTSGNIFNNWVSSMNFFSIGILLFFLESRLKNKKYD